jgi:flagellar assembly protein FliH
VERMSSSRIIRDGDQDKTVTPYHAREMGNNGKNSKIKEIQEQAEAILRTAREEKESIEMEAYTKGLEQGQAQGQMMAVKKIEPLMATLSKAVDDLRRIRQQIVEKHQDQVMEILFLIAEKIIHRQIQLSPDIVLDTVKEAARYLTETDEIRLRLHPSDFEYLRDIERLLSKHLSGNMEIHFVEDSTLDRGGIVIDTEFGEIDASIRSQIEHMKEVLLEK